MEIPKQFNIIYNRSTYEEINFVIEEPAEDNIPDHNSKFNKSNHSEINKSI